MTRVRDTLPRIDATKAEKAALEEIFGEYGDLSEALVVKASRSKSSPLHARFLWNNEAGAARIGRLEIARKLIMSVRVARAAGSGPREVLIEVRQWHGSGAGGYSSVDDVLSQPDLRAAVLEEALVAFEQLGHKFCNLSELAGVRKAVADVRKILNKLGDSHA